MNEYVQSLAGAAGLTENVIRALAVLLTLLLVSTAVRLTRLLLVRVDPAERRARLGSLLTWWVLSAGLAAVVLLGTWAAVTLFAAVSLLGLREYARLVRGRVTAPPGWWLLAFLAVPAHYLSIPLGEGAAFWTAFPVWVLMLLSIRLVVAGQTAGFLTAVGLTFLGLMLTAYLLSHAVLLLDWPGARNPRAGGVGLFLYLAILTEVNDIAQALWGRRLGRRRITPDVSPGKTWEGFLLGAATTVLLACLLAGYLTPFADADWRLGRFTPGVPYLGAVASGLLIAVAGFFGDLTMSAVKRDVGVKDSGTLLPGQGGVLDRVDSLTFTAPLFYYFSNACCG